MSRYIDLKNKVDDLSARINKLGGVRVIKNDLAMLNYHRERLLDNPDLVADYDSPFEGSIKIDMTPIGNVVEKAREWASKEPEKRTSFCEVLLTSEELGDEKTHVSDKYRSDSSQTPTIPNKISAKIAPI